MNALEAGSGAMLASNPDSLRGEKGERGTHYLPGNLDSSVKIMHTTRVLNVNYL